MEALQWGVGDPSRFGPFRDRLEILIEEQARTWASGASGWIVVPIQRHPAGFYLLSEDREGQRRGREVLQAFLGPATATIESVTLVPQTEDADRHFHAAGLVHLSYVRRTDATSADLLDRVEDAIATIKGKDARPRPVRLSHVDLLRDFRLALLQRDGRVADRVLEELRLTGQLSAENLRFLTIEMLGRLERWRELRELPYLMQLLQARRPRAVNEILLEMLWWTELAEPCATGRSPRDVYSDADLGARFGAVLSAIDVPGSSAGRAVGVVAALALDDSDRLKRLLNSASDEVERERLQRLVLLGQPSRPRETAVGSDVQTLFGEGQYGAVIQAFLELPDPSTADLAVQAILETEDGATAPAVLRRVQTFIAEEQLRPGRRLLRDLQDLARFVDNSCTGWVQWCTRLGRDERWPDAAQILRTQYAQWEDLRVLPPAMVEQAAIGVFDAWTGTNQDQVVAGLDVLCRVAAATALVPHAAEFCEVVLLVLAEQHNLSAPVREAYLLLLEQLLESGPAESRYRKMVEQAALLWRRIAAPTAVDWGLGLIDILLNASAPAADFRMTVVAEILSKTRDFQRRLSLRQRSEWEALAEEIGLQVQRLTEPTDEEDTVWRRLDGAVIGVYTLLPRAADSLGRRLSRLCSPSSVEGNADTVATEALQSLATRADYLIVDTWHAAHAATAAIDAVRPRRGQIMPQGRGVTAFLQALEHFLALTAS
nr:protein DpdD [Planosporangium thailandense]